MPVPNYVFQMVQLQYGDGLYHHKMTGVSFIRLFSLSSFQNSSLLSSHFYSTSFDVRMRRLSSLRVPLWYCGNYCSILPVESRCRLERSFFHVSGGHCP